MPEEFQNLQEYVDSFHRGEEKGFTFFFRMLYPPLCQFAVTILKDQPLAEDLVQECFITLWNKKPLLNNPNSLKSYLYTMVRNKCLKHLRHQTKLSISHNEFEHLTASTESAIIEKIIFAETTHDIHIAINSLPVKMQRVFRMFYIEGKDCSEIAEELHLSPHTIRSQRIRALFLLKKKLGSSLVMLLFLNNH